MHARKAINDFLFKKLIDFLLKYLTDFLLKILIDSASSIFIILFLKSSLWAMVRSVDYVLRLQMTC